MNNIREFYDASAESWASDSRNDLTMLPVLTEFLKDIPKDEPILDIGCGTGYETMRVRNIGYSVVGIDFSKQSIKIAQRHSPDIVFKVGDALVDLDNMYSFGGCIAIALIIHFSKDELLIFFNNIYNHLSKNGKLLVVFKLGTGLDENSSNKTYNETSYFRPVYLYTLSDILDISKKKFLFYKQIKGESSNWMNVVLVKKD